MAAAPRQLVGQQADAVGCSPTPQPIVLEPSTVPPTRAAERRVQVDKILDAVVGSTAAGMVEASLAPAADSGMEDVAPESSQNQPVPLVCLAWARHHGRATHTEAMIVQLPSAHFLLGLGLSCPGAQHARPHMLASARLEALRLRPPPVARRLAMMCSRR